MDASLCALCKSLASDHCPNSCLPLSEKNGLSMFPHKALTTSSVSMNRILCASLGHSAPPEASNRSPNPCPLLSEKNGFLCASSGNPAPLEESVPGLIGEIECSRDALSEVVPSNGQLNTPVCERNVDEACDMSSIPEVRKQNTSSLRNQQIQERPFFIKAVRVKKGISKNKMGAIHPKAKAQGKIDASNNVQIQLKENNNSTGKEIVCALTQQVSGGTSSGDTEGVNFKKLATKEGSGLLDKELSPMINRVCQANRNVDVCIDTAATQVKKSNPLTEIPILSLDHLVQQDGSKVDEKSSMLHPQNAKSSEPQSLSPTAYNRGPPPFLGDSLKSLIIRFHLLRDHLYGLYLMHGMCLRRYRSNHIFVHLWNFRQHCVKEWV